MTTGDEMLTDARVAGRLPAQNLERARRFYAEKLGLEPADAAVTELKRRGVVFEEVDAPGLETHNSIADITGNYPSKNATGERGAWFRDSEGNMLGIGQLVR
jgi:catechol 2,3-dioxygenase-like lactoylglutathione lyase family enzyme